MDAASEADAVILIVGTNSDWETEGNDRGDLNLPTNQNALIDAVLNTNKNTALIINTGSPVNIPWSSKAKAILQTWFAGQEFGNALFDILSGEINPSGKLPTSFPMRIEDTPAFKSYPGKNLQMNYDEKLLIGYRWYEKQSIQPLFCFGHGLSYTKFKYKNLEINIEDNKEVSCKFSIENTGEISGAEIAQCYLRYTKNLENEPNKTLQGFCKVNIDAHDEKNVEIRLTQRNFSYWSIDTKSWQIRDGSYEILIGSSVENIYLKSSIKLEKVLDVL